jgi:predicted ABC-type ATPase
VTSHFDARPVVVAIAGPNGAGKTTFYEAHLQTAGLRFVNADDLARELEVDAYAAAEVAGRLRETLLAQGESFIFETVFSDPVGDEIAFLERAGARGYTVVLCFIGIDVPLKKLKERYPRTLGNLGRANRGVPHVLVFDNSDMDRPFRMVARFEKGTMVEKHAPVPRWVPHGR